MLGTLVLMRIEVTTFLTTVGMVMEIVVIAMAVVGMEEGI
jgi:hypothetical protein